MGNSGKKINIILIFKLYPIPGNWAKQWGDDKGKIEAPVAHNGAQVWYNIADEQKEGEAEAKGEKQERSINIIEVPSSEKKE